MNRLKYTSYRNYNKTKDKALNFIVILVAIVLIMLLLTILVYSIYSIVHPLLIYINSNHYKKSRLLKNFYSC